MEDYLYDNHLKALRKINFRNQLHKARSLDESEFNLPEVYSDIQRRLKKFSDLRRDRIKLDYVLF